MSNDGLYAVMGLVTVSVAMAVTGAIIESRAHGRRRAFEDTPVGAAVHFVLGIVALCLSLGAAMVFFGLAMLPQIGLAFILAKGGGPMLLVLVATVVLALLAERKPDPQSRALSFIAFAIVIIMAMGRGYYWNLFGRGEGFFTVNRVSAFLVYVLVFYATFALMMRRRVREHKRRLGLPS